MHPDEIDITPAMVARLIREQFPQWAELPLREVRSTGTVNAIYRLGEDLAVRLCRVPWGVGEVDTERVWLPRLAPLLPVAIPEQIAEGRPNADYPWPWSILRWLDGGNPVPGRLTRPSELAADLAGFIRDFRAIELPGPPNAYRGGPLSKLDGSTRKALAELGDTLDVDAATAVWEAALAAPSWDGPPTWIHADLLPGNLLTVDGRLSGVIDFACFGVGDPSCDLIPAWNLLPPEVRPAFRAGVGADDATWARARGRALAMAQGIAYYRESNPDFSAHALHTVNEAITDFFAHP